MEKTAKRIGIALLAVLLVALLCAGIALALPQAETPLASADGSSSLDTSVRSVTVGDRVYDLSNWQDANAYYEYLVGQGYTPITDQPSLDNFVKNNGGDSSARGAMKPYTADGQAISYKFGNAKNNEKSPYDDSTMGKDGVFRATLNGCGANVEIYVNQQWEGTYSTQHDSAGDAQTHLIGASGTVTTILSQIERSSFTGGLANVARGATLQNLNMRISKAATVLNGAKNRACLIGGVFGAMYDTTVNNCSLDISGDINGTKNGNQYADAGSCTLAIGGLTAYALDSTISNFSLTLNGDISAISTGYSNWGDTGNPRAAVSGVVAISQGLDMYNMIVTGSGTVSADLNEPWESGINPPKHIARAGALVGIVMSTENGEAETFGYTSSAGGSTTINGVLTNYNGYAKYQDLQGSSDTWYESNTGMLIGSTGVGVITNLYWDGDSVPSTVKFSHNADFTATTVTASTDKGSASIYFKNETGTADSLAGLQITYTAPTAPSDSGSILWSYTDSGTSDGEVDMHSVQPYETYTVSWPRSLTASRSVTFTTGRRVRYFVRHDGADITDRGGMDAEPVKTKQFDNTPYAVPTLQIWSIDSKTNLGEQQNASYWGIFDGEVDSSWDTAVDVTVYNVRLIDAFSSSTKYDFVDNTNRYIAYKSDNSNGASRNYRFEITAREITVSITPPEFVYEGKVQNPTFELANTVDGDEPQPTVTAQYFNSLGVEIDFTQVVNAGDYSVSLTGVDDKNYTITNLDDYQNYAFSIDKRPITITPSGYEGLTYNGAPKYPDAVIGNAIEGNDTQIVTFNYYAASDVNRPINEDERINAGDYQMRAELVDVNNYVLDNSLLEQGDGLTFTDTSVTIDYTVGKADLQFKGSDDGTYSFVYFAQPVTTLAALNKAIGGDASPTQYYFQPVDPTNSVDVNVGESGATFTVRKDGSAAQMLDVGTYQVTVSYSSNNFNSIETSFEVVVTPRPLILNFAQDDSYTYSFQYGDAVTDYEHEQPQGAQPDDELKFGTVYYKDSVAPENKLGAKPTAVGKYVASYEPTGTGLDLDVDLILGNYIVSPDANSTIEFEITKKDITVAYDGNMSFVYDGTAHSDVSVTSVKGIIDSEQDLYNADTLKVTYTKDGSTADTARNAGEYTLGAAPTADDNGAFVNNYNITNAPTFTIDKAPLTITLQEYSASYADTVGTIPYVEGEGGTYIITAGEIFSDDRTDAEGDNLFVVTITDGPITELRDYTFTMALNADNSNAANYDLTVNGSGVIHVEGTPVFAGVYVYDESGEIVGSGFADAAAEGAYDITVSVVYGAQTYRAEFGTRTTAGSIEGISFDDPSSVTGGATSGKSGNGYPFISARNAGTYTAVFTLAADAQGKFYFPGEGKDSAYSINVTFVIEQREVTVAPNAVEQTYGDEFKDAGYSVAGDEDGSIAAMLEADGFAPTYTSTTNASTAANTTGKVTLTQAFAAGSESNAKNYVFTPEEGTVTVVPRPVTVSVTTSGSAVYGDGAPEITAIAAAEGSNTIIDGDADGLIAGLNADGVLDLANRNVGSTKIVIVEGKNEIGNYTVTLAEDTGVVQVTPKKIIVDVADGIVPYGATEADIRPANGVYFNGEPEFAYDDATKEFVFKIADGDVDLTTQEPDTIPSVLQIAFVDETLNGNYDFEFTNGDLTVEAMTLEAGQVRVELEKDTYDGTVIGYDIFVGTVNVTDADPTRLIVTINGSADTEILNAGDYEFAISGDGEYYQGNVTVTVTVKQADISGMDFSLNKTRDTYTGSVIDVRANTDIAVSLAVTQDGKEAQLVNAGTYTVTVTPTDPNYTGSKTFEFTIDKAPHKAPVQTELTIEVAWDSVTVTHDSFTVQLSKDGTKWVDTTMEGYEANSSYTLHVRFKEDANHSASSNTIMISGKTAERTAVEFTIAGVEEHYNRAVLTITFEEAFSGKVQFSIDGGKTWKDLTVQGGKYVASGLAESSEYTLQVKIPAGDDYLESEVKSVKVKTGIDPAKYTETLAMFGETFSAGDLVNYETLKEQFNGLTEADKAGVDAAKFATITAARDAFVASVNSDIEDIQNVAAKTAGRAVAAAAAAVTAAAIALFIAKRKFI